MDFVTRRSLNDIEEYKVEYVAAEIIVNANENNFPIPEKVAEKIEKIAKDFPFNRYPPIKAENLCETIAEGLELYTENVKIGNGSSELLQTACYVFGGLGKKIAIPYPSFSMYGVYVQMSDSTAVQYHLSDDGFLDADKLISFCRKENPDLLIICNPNNPTGNYNELSVVEKIIGAVQCPVIVDEAYMEFADGKDVPLLDMRPLDKVWLVAGSTLSLIGNYSNLICFRTFSKAYGLAGLRCGYAVGTAQLIKLLGKALLPYNVNSYSLMVAKVVYENKLLYKTMVKTIREERDKMAEFLRKLGFSVWPSSTNFLLFCAQGFLSEKLAAACGKKYGGNLPDVVASGKMLYRYFLENGILVRDYTTHPYLTGCLRITLGRPEENKIILDKLVALNTEVRL